MERCLSRQLREDRLELLRRDDREIGEVLEFLDLPVSHGAI